MQVSAGFDAHWRDPLAGLQFRTSTFHHLAAQVKNLANAVAGILAAVVAQLPTNACSLVSCTNTGHIIIRRCLHIGASIAALGIKIDVSVASCHYFHLD